MSGNSLNNGCAWAPARATAPAASGDALRVASQEAAACGTEKRAAIHALLTKLYATVNPAKLAAHPGHVDHLLEKYPAEALLGRFVLKYGEEVTTLMSSSKPAEVSATDNQDKDRQARGPPSSRTLRRRRSKAKGQLLAACAAKDPVATNTSPLFPRTVQKGAKRSKGKETRRQFCSKRKLSRAMVQAQKKAKKVKRRLQHEGKQRHNLQQNVRQGREVISNLNLQIRELKQKLGM